MQDVKGEKLDLTSNKLTFSGKTEQAEYQLELGFFGEIDTEASKVSVSPRNIFCVIVKKEEGHWDRLTKESGKHLSFVKCDWNK
jgi:cytosolic prostaglandin-E synthase